MIWIKIRKFHHGPEIFGSSEEAALFWTSCQNCRTELNKKNLVKERVSALLTNVSTFETYIRAESL